MQTLYDVLGVPVSATQGVVHDAYRRLLLRFHPDRCYHDNDSAVYNPSAELDEARMRVLDKAYEVLSNPKKRRLYDAYLAHKLRSNAVQYAPSFPQQWAARTAAGDSPMDDVLGSMLGMRVTSLAPPPAGSKLYMSSYTVSAPSNTGNERTQQQQAQQKTAPMTETLNTPMREIPSTAAAARPIVYTAAISMQRQPDGTVAVRTYKSGPQPINVATVAEPAKTDALPRRVQVMEQQLNYKVSPTSEEGAGDGFNDVVTALKNSVVSLVAAATDA